MPPLKNPQHERFCREYVACRFNATDAYRAVYPKSTPKSARTAGPRLLANVDVSARVAEIARTAAAEADITPARVIRELGFIAFQRKSQLYRPDGTLKSPAEWDEATDATIAGIETEAERVTEGDEGHGVTTAARTHRVKRFDKVKALELLGKHFGLWKEDAPHPDRKTFDLSVLPDATKRALLDALRQALGGAPAGGPAVPARRA